MPDLSEDTIKQLAVVIDREAQAWAKEWLQNRAAQLRNKRIQASGNLINSLSAQVTQTLNSTVLHELSIGFEEHGRFLDMKGLTVKDGGSGYIANLAEWIERKNLRQKFQDSYLKKAKRKAEPSDLTLRMAWAVAVKRSRTPPRRRAWYAKAKGGGVSDLFNRVAANIPDIVAEELKKAFQQ